MKVPLNDCNGSAGMKTRKCLSLRETADTIRHVSAPAAECKLGFGKALLT